jgi:hypothetical protein
MAAELVRRVACVWVGWLAGTLALPCSALDLEPKLTTNNPVVGGTPVGLEVSGNYAYVVVREAGLQVFDVSDPTRLRVIGGYRTSGYAVDVAVSGGYAYLASQRRVNTTAAVGGGLDVIDISSDPANPRRVGGYSDRDCVAIAVSGNYAYIAERTSLRIMDISNPAAPGLAGLIPTAAWEVAIAGDYAFVMQLSQGFHIFDVSDPANYALIGMYVTNGNFQDIIISSNRAYLADQSAGVHIIDITDLGNPQLVSTYLSSPLTLGVSGNYLYVGAQPRTINTNDVAGGLHIVDASDPANPQRITRYDAMDVVHGVTLLGNYAYVVDGTMLSVIDVADPMNPTLAGGYLVEKDARDVALSGGYAYVADGLAGLEVFDVSVLSNPRRVGGLFLGGAANSVAVAGNHAFVVSTGALNIIHISNPAAPRPIASYYTRDDARNVTLSGNFAYVASKSGTNRAGGGLHVIDIRDPANPGLWGRYVRSNAVDVTVAGNYAYLTTEPQRDGGAIRVPGALDVLDITIPSNPTRVGRYVMTEQTLGVAVAGDYAYVADGHAGLHVINVSNKAKPELVTTFAPTAYTSGSVIIGPLTASAFTHVIVASNHCYAGELFLEFDHGVRVLGSSVQIIDVSDPRGPKRVGSARVGEYHQTRAYTFGSHAQGMVLSDKHVLVAGGRAGLQAIDISAPAASQVLGSYGSLSAGAGFTVAGNHLYAASQRRWTGSNYIAGGLGVLDISNPARPQLIRSFEEEDATDVAVSGTNACVIGGVTAFRTFDISDPASPKPLGGYDDLAVYVKVALSDDYAYVAAKPISSRGGLHVISVTNPAAPQFVSRYDPGGEAFDLAVFGNYAYLAQAPRFGASNCLAVIDITNPANPLRVGVYGPTGSARGVAIAGNYAYLAGYGIGLHVLDISNPTNPQRVGQNSSIGDTEAVTVSAGYAYATDSEGRLHVLDIRDPANPRRVGDNTSFTSFFSDVPSAARATNGKVFARTAAHGVFILHPYYPIRFQRITHPNNAAIELQITGPPGVPGRVQRSADLLNWTDWLPVNFGESPLEVSDDAAASAQFYRIAVP